MAGFAFILLLGLALAWAGAVWFAAHRLRHPPRRTYTSALARGAPGDPGELPPARRFEEWTLRVPQAGAPRARALDVPVWDVPGEDPAGPLVILTPGWGDSRIGALSRMPALLPHCSRIYAWDPPGAGDAPGLCALGTTEHEAIIGLVDHARAAGALGAGAVLFGWSLGAGASIVAAERLAHTGEVVGVVAEAPYRLAWTPARRVMRLAGYPHRANLRPAFALLGARLGVGPAWRGFDRAAHAAAVAAPLLVLHGEHDEICPVADGEAVAQAPARGRIAIIPGAGHNDLWTAPEFSRASAEAVANFLRSLRAEALRDSPGASA